MLRLLEIKNYVKFKERQRLKFQEGLNLFVGENDCGKSCAIESIRRCMSLQSNTTLSRPHEEGQLSYVVTVFETSEYDRIVSCIFRLPAEKDTDRKYLPTTSAEKDKPSKSADTGESGICLYDHAAQRNSLPTTDGEKNQPSTSSAADEPVSTMPRQAGQSDSKASESLNKGTSCYKLVAKKSKDKQWEFGLDRVVETKQQNENTILNNTEYSIDDSKFFEQHFDFDFLEKEKDWDDFASDFIQHVSKRTEERTEEERTPCCEELLRTITEHTAFTFANRSIGSIQWSRSKKVSGIYKEDNYKTAQALAEILCWFLEETKKHGDAPDAPFEGQEELFKFITDDSGYLFELAGPDGKEQIVAKRYMQEQPNHARTTEDIYLLKVPEGILEAKNCAILLTAKLFQTVCHEEPERGMHPQMIARLRDSMLDIQGKVVIATTHNPAFLNFNTASRTFLFRKTDRNQSWICSGKDVFKSPESTYSLTQVFISRLFFGKRLLFVEGISDELLITTLFRALIKKIKDDSEAFKPFFKRLLGLQHDNFDDSLVDFKRFVSSLDVIHMDGAGRSKHVFEARKEMKIEGYFLLDYDEILGRSSRERLEKELVEKKVEFDPDKQRNHEIQSLYVRQYEDVGILIWESGAIENVTKQLTEGDPEPPLKQKLKNLHILNDSGKLFRKGRYSSEDWSTGGEAILDVCMAATEQNDINRFIRFLARFALTQMQLP